MKIEAPKHVTVKDGIVRAIVRSTYTFGKSVKGEATVEFSAAGYRNSDASLTFKIDGKANVDYAIGSEIQNWFQQLHKDEIKCTLSATVSDPLTGELTLIRHRSNLEDSFNFGRQKCDNHEGNHSP